jgi:hypothetical protein
MRQAFLAPLPLLLAVACGTSKSSTDLGTPAPEAGLTLIIPAAVCPDASVTASPDAGACVSVQRRSFSQDIVPIFDSCSGEVCHSFANGGIASAIDQPSTECCSALKLIEPYHPERSYVLRKLLGQNLCAGAQMPLARTPFPADQTQIVADWICQGASTAN